MTIESAGPYTRGPRDLIEAGPRSFFSEGGLRRFEQADAVALGIGARFAGGSGLLLLFVIDHAENTP
jgi:hypothetical protein